MSLGLVFGFGSAGTFAYWTDQATVTGVTLTAGKLNLELNDDDAANNDDSVAMTSLQLSTMVPGQSVAAVLKVENGGLAPEGPSTVPFTYTATTSISGSTTLAGALDLKVAVGGSVSGSSPNATCTGGTTLSPPTKLNQNLVSTARSLAASSSENLCIQISMPSNADTSLQGLTTTATFTFTATQQ